MQCEMDGLRTLALILSVHFLFNTRTHFAELGSDLGPLGHLVNPERPPVLGLGPNMAQHHQRRLWMRAEEAPGPSRLRLYHFSDAAVLVEIQHRDLTLRATPTEFLPTTMAGINIL